MYFLILFLLIEPIFTLSTANSEQVITKRVILLTLNKSKKHSTHFPAFEQESHFDDFEQFKIKIIIWLNLNKSKSTVAILLTLNKS